jgi:recombination protein RecT
MTAPAPSSALVTQVRAGLAQREDQLVSLLGPTIPVERFTNVALHAVNSNPDLLRCTPLSIIEAIREAASLRLEPTGLLGDAFLVRYGDKARLMPGYRGLMRLARRSGEIDMLDAQVVYAADEFDIDLGSQPRVVHRPALDTDRGNYRGAYAWARMRTGELKVEWMSYADIEQVRRSSKAATNGPWVAFWGEMARKSVLRRLLKQLPANSDVERALELDAEAEQQADRPARQANPALRAIRSKLGVIEGEYTEGDAEPLAANPDPDPSASAVSSAHAAASGDVTAAAPGQDEQQPEGDGGHATAPRAAAVAYCGTESPWPDAPGECVLPAGHRNAHRNAKATWTEGQQP